MKTTVFNETHRKLGAKMVEFAGFDMPVQYEGVTAEHLHVRSKVGVFDVSHMGEFTVKGPKALALLQSSLIVPSSERYMTGSPVPSPESNVTV